MDPRLYIAAVQGDLSAFREVVAEHQIEAQPEQLLLNITTQDKNNVLHIAVGSSHNSEEFVRYIIRLSPSLLAQKNSNGETPLHIVAKTGLLEMLYRLVRGLNDVNDDVLRMTATEELRKMHSLKIHSRFSCDRGSEDLLLAVPHILEASHPLSVYSDWAGRTTLHRAIIADKDVSTWAETFPEMIKSKDIYGWTPLHYASRFGYCDSVRKLLDIDNSCAYEADKRGTYGHLIAARKGHDSVIKAFYDHCPDCFELRDGEGRTALHIALEAGQS